MITAPYNDGTYHVSSLSLAAAALFTMRSVSFYSYPLVSVAG